MRLAMAYAEVHVNMHVYNFCIRGSIFFVQSLKWVNFDILNNIWELIKVIKLSLSKNCLSSEKLILSRKTLFIGDKLSFSTD